MKRLDFCEVTEFHPERLKSLARRGLLPFALPESDGKWARMEYSGFRAALLVALAELTDGGMPIEIASQTLLKRETEISRGPWVIEKDGAKPGHLQTRRNRKALTPSDPADDLWIGLAVTPDDQEPTFLFGALKEVVANLTEGSPLSDPSKINYGRLALVNFSQAQRTVAARAAKLKISLND